MTTHPPADPITARLRAAVRSRRTAASKAVAGVACAVMLASAPAAVAADPAPSFGVIPARCSIDGFDLYVRVYYEPDGTGIKVYKYVYRLTNSLTYSGSFSYARGEYDNFNVKVVTDGVGGPTYYSPDDRLAGVVYTQHAGVRVDPSDDTHIDFEGIFDVAGAGDPRCWARTPELTP